MNNSYHPANVCRTLFPGLLLWLRFPALISWCAISIGIFTASAYTQNHHPIIVPYSTLYYSGLITATISICCNIVFKKPLIRSFFSFFAGALVFILYYGSREYDYTQLQSHSEKEVTLYGTARSPSLPYPENIRFLFSVDSTTPPLPFLYNKVVQCVGRDYAVQGADCAVKGVIKTPQRRNYPYEFDEYRYLLSNGILTKFAMDSLISVDSTLSFTADLSNTFRQSVGRVINSFPDPDHRAILYASFLGETEYFSEHLKMSFRNSGIYHLLSISGLHAAILSGACYFLLRLFPIPLLYRHCIALLVLWTYQIFIGFIPCLFRATIMATIIILTFAFQKKNYSLQAIGIAGSIWLLISPESLFQAGYQLSFAATFGILALHPVLCRFQPDIKSRPTAYLLSNVLSSFYLSCAGILSTVPILLYHFGNVSIYGLIANLAAVPLMTIAMWCFFTSLIFAWCIPFCTFIPVALSKWLLDMLVVCADSSFYFPFSSIECHALTITMTLLFIVAGVACATVSQKHQKTTVLAASAILLISIPIEYFYTCSRPSVTITRFTNNNALLYAVKWPGNRVSFFTNSNNNRTTRQLQRTAQTWLQHQHYATVEKFYNVSPAKRKRSLSTSRSLPIEELSFESKTDSLKLIYSSNSKQSHHSDTCLLIKSGASLSATIYWDRYSIIFSLTDPLQNMVVYDKATGANTRFTGLNQVIHLKKNSYSVQ